MIMTKDGPSKSNDHTGTASRDHRDLFVWPFVLGECQGSCGRGILGLNRRCRSGLDCARDNQDAISAYGLDRQFAYCRIANFRGRRYFCYDPKKLISPSVQPSVSYKTTSKPSTKPSVKPSFKPSYQPTPTPKRCFMSNSELKSAASLYNASNTIQTYGNISAWCVGLVTDFSFIFSTGLVNSFNEDISKWDTSNATSMYGMFQGAASFNQDISQWNVSKVTDMRNMFYGATSFNQDLSGWNISKVTAIINMFYGTTSFNQDISGWDVSKVTSMYSMFYSASSFNKDISKWDVSKVTDMSYMFNYATSFNQDLSDWNISKVTNIGLMFYGATSFNRSLCVWNSKCQFSTASFFAFFSTSCPNQSNPVCGSGPFCFGCN